MKQYEKFDEYLNMSKGIKKHCDEIERLLSYTLTLPLDEEGILGYMNGVGKPLKMIDSYLKKLKGN